MPRRTWVSAALSTRRRCGSFCNRIKSCRNVAVSSPFFQIEFDSAKFRSRRCSWASCFLQRAFAHHARALLDLAGKTGRAAGLAVPDFAIGADGNAGTSRRREDRLPALRGKHRAVTVCKAERHGRHAFSSSPGACAYRASANFRSLTVSRTTLSALTPK